MNDAGERTRPERFYSTAARAARSTEPRVRRHPAGERRPVRRGHIRDGLRHAVARDVRVRRHGAPAAPDRADAGHWPRGPGHGRHV